MSPFKCYSGKYYFSPFKESSAREVEGQTFFFFSSDAVSRLETRCIFCLVHDLGLYSLKMLILYLLVSVSYHCTGCSHLLLHIVPVVAACRYCYFNLLLWYLLLYYTCCCCYCNCNGWCCCDCYLL